MESQKYWDSLQAISSTSINETCYVPDAGLGGATAGIDSH